MKNKSFTLIEILTTIVIIGIISSVIVVSIASSIEEAKMAKSQAFAKNMRDKMMFNVLQNWSFDEGSGTMTYDINDSSNSGVLANMGIAAGSGDSGSAGWLSSKYCVSGTCLNFKGDEDVAALPSVDITDTGYLPLFTLSTWVYNISGGDSRHSMVRNFWEIVGQDVCFWADEFDDDYWRCSINSKIVYNKWTYIVTIWDGIYITHYINGEFNWKDSLASAGTSGNLYQIAGYSARRMKGRLDEMVIYDKNLSLSEVKENYIAGLNSLLAQGGISNEEYAQRIELLAKK
ncbi:MAG: prepilin-type N-terminal cleavage/methylation domain-containing protein [Candidatus ainarchaeum sp.]|nr:prepilin-type N-terminal cleavage/methylation domain-containing protein [Candidatus ainarchaeum sp.]